MAADIGELDGYAGTKLDCLRDLGEDRALLLLHKRFHGNASQASAWLMCRLSDIATRCSGRSRHCRKLSIYDRGNEMLDVGDMIRWFKRVCVPRYVAGHEQFGPAERTDCERYWLQHAVEEAADLSFYLRQLQRGICDPPEGSSLRVYIAGPYRAATPHEIIEHIGAARDAMAELLKAGHTPFCPHSMTARFERDYPEIGDDVYLRLGLLWLRQCHGVLVLPGWEQSEGTLIEVAEAHRLGMPLWYSLEDVPEVCSVAD